MFNSIIKSTAYPAYKTLRSNYLRRLRACRPVYTDLLEDDAITMPAGLFDLTMTEEDFVPTISSVTFTDTTFGKAVWFQTQGAHFVIKNIRDAKHGLQLAYRLARLLANGYNPEHLFSDWEKQSAYLFLKAEYLETGVTMQFLHAKKYGYDLYLPDYEGVEFRV